MQHSLTTGFSAGFNWLFLPRGYPQSVSEDYLAYQVWDTLQGFCDYLKGILLTLSFLKGLGVGSSTGSLDAAMLVWIVRETTGVCCGLIAGMPTFTIHFSDRLQLRKWRLVSEAIKAVAGGTFIRSCAANANANANENADAGAGGVCYDVSMPLTTLPVTHILLHTYEHISNRNLRIIRRSCRVLHGNSMRGYCLQHSGWSHGVPDAYCSVWSLRQDE